MSVSGKPLLCDLNDCHLTLNFMPNQDKVRGLPFGRKVRMKLIGHSEHEFVQCFLVDILDESVGKLMKNKCPHITVSFNRKRCRPQYSNTVLNDGKVVSLLNDCDKDEKAGKRTKELVVEGTVGAQYSNSSVTFENPYSFHSIKEAFAFRKKHGMCRLQIKL